MNIGSDEKQHVARLLSFFLSGEKVAHRCAVKQATLCNDTNMQRFLLRQARQEKFHAITFQAAILWLTPKGVKNPAQSQMQQYELLLSAAIKKNDLFNSVLGLQVILEGMGDIALNHLDNGIKLRDIGYQKIRRTILAQEDTHHEFGLNYVAKQPDAIIDYHQADDFLPLIHNMFISLEILFEYFDSDSNQYFKAFQQQLPDWAQGHAFHNHTNT